MGISPEQGKKMERCLGMSLGTRDEQTEIKARGRMERNKSEKREGEQGGKRQRERERERERERKQRGNIQRNARGNAVKRVGGSVPRGEKSPGGLVGEARTCEHLSKHFPGKLMSHISTHLCWGVDCFTWA